MAIEQHDPYGFSFGVRFGQLLDAGDHEGIMALLERAKDFTNRSVARQVQEHGLMGVIRRLQKDEAQRGFLDGDQLQRVRLTYLLVNNLLQHLLSKSIADGDRETGIALLFQLCSWNVGRSVLSTLCEESLKKKEPLDDLVVQVFPDFYSRLTLGDLGIEDYHGAHGSVEVLTVAAAAFLAGKKEISGELVDLIGLHPNFDSAWDYKTLAKHLRWVTGQAAGFRKLLYKKWGKVPR